jgi:hypothetical protein
VLARLARGVNISGWLQHGAPAAQAPHAPGAADWRRIRALGLRHARILVDPEAFVGDRGLPDPAALGALRAAIDAALREDLLVVVALQLPRALKLRLGASEPDRIALGGLWRALASALRGFPATRLVLEPLNEPETDAAPASRALMLELVGELRRALPEHTLVVAGHRYSAIDELLALQPLPDANLVYGFHYYEPYNFTHQGANWGDPMWRVLRNFPYPSSPAIVAPLLPALKGKAQEYLRWHGEQNWNRAKIHAQLDRVAQWARQHGVPVWCSEFGVLRARTKAAHRQAWLRDVRDGLEARGIGWSHWDYAGAFGMDRGAIEALGLAPSPAPSARPLPQGGEAKKP